MEFVANGKVILFLLFVSTSVLIVSPASPPRFHYINPHNFTTPASSSSSASASAVHRSRNNNNPSLSLVHRDAISGATYPSRRHQVVGLVARDNARVEHLEKRLVASTSPYLPEDLVSEVVPGVDDGSGEYFVRVGVGSPPTDQYLVVDSGSDVIWVQCRPCEQCYAQTDPLFDPAASSSFSGVSCGSAICRTLSGTGCGGGGDAGKCDYSVTYGDGSYTKGELALETLTLGGTAVQGVAIGCGHRNSGLFVGAAGLLGLGWGAMSLIGQLGGAAGGVFSYCLASRGAGGRSLVLGGPRPSPWAPCGCRSCATTRRRASTTSG